MVVFAVSVHSIELMTTVAAADNTPKHLVGQKQLQVHLDMYSHSLSRKQMFTAALLGSDLVHPCFSLHNGTEHSYVYCNSCQGEVTKDAKVSSVLLQCGHGSCTTRFALFASIDHKRWHAAWYRRMQAAIAQQ